MGRPSIDGKIHRAQRATITIKTIDQGTGAAGEVDHAAEIALLSDHRVGILKSESQAKITRIGRGCSNTHIRGGKVHSVGGVENGKAIVAGDARTIGITSHQPRIRAAANHIEGVAQPGTRQRSTAIDKGWRGGGFVVPAINLEWIIGSVGGEVGHVDRTIVGHANHVASKKCRQSHWWY